jgi:thiamine-monophosphate kinase
LRSGEFATIERLKEQFHEGRAAGILLGIGDDAAVLEPPLGVKLVWTIDEQVERTHFRRDLVGWVDVGWRSFMAAASDLAAMGAEPWCALTAVSLPADFEDEDLDALARGQQAAAVKLGTKIVGGNLTRGEAVVVTTTLLGTAVRPVARSGAREGDGIWIAGPVGLAAAGLMALERALLDERIDAAAEAWLRPVARLSDGRILAPVAHAAIDVSDGLAQDLAHIVEASGVDAVLDEGALREHAAAGWLGTIAEILGVDPLSLMLHGGEDYALIAASDVPLDGFWCAGHFVAATNGPSRVTLRTRSGDLRPVEARGFDHFR